MIHRFIQPSSPVVQISGSEGLPPPVNMTERITSRWPRNANRTRNGGASEMLLFERSRTSWEPSLLRRAIATDPELFRLVARLVLGGDLPGMLFGMGNKSASPNRGGGRWSF